MNTETADQVDLFRPTEPAIFCCGRQPRMDYTIMVDGVQPYVRCRQCKRRGPDRQTAHEAVQAWNEMTHEQPYSDSRMWKVTAVVLVLGVIALIALSLLAMHKVEARDGVRTEQR